MRDKQSVEQEYDGFYRGKPNKWASDARNGFAYETLAKRIGRAPKTLLDIGCGVGHTIAYLHERWPETQYTGLDLSEVGIDLSRKRCPYARFERGWLGEVEIGTFEAVILLGVAEHLENLVEGLKAARDTMAPGGVMYIEVPNCIAYETSEPVEGFRPINQGNRQHEWHLFRETWEQRLAEAGLFVLDRLKGPSITTEFVWTLARVEDAWDL